MNIFLQTLGYWAILISLKQGVSYDDEQRCKQIFWKILNNGKD